MYEQGPVPRGRPSPIPLLVCPSAPRASQTWGQPLSQSVSPKGKGATDATATQLKAAWDGAALPSDGDRRLCGQLLIPNNCQVDCSMSQTQEGLPFYRTRPLIFHTLASDGELKGPPTTTQNPVLDVVPRCLIHSLSRDASPSIDGASSPPPSFSSTYGRAPFNCNPIV